ncbi:MAG: aminoalkylphosphonic acid N-acetyltransferase [Candidatus Methanofastidiosum methylothiophilum]|uniref:Aminoalkylphosphonic acid N-acetyltransferase n=1 Tax=Candidatus Methanofastidiosum methylothiophilum TaxID=1705564 RepID=A0A150INZ6_9EURY|nr:MAG: aminoalkylphosphonic acid N-acetyltransferase [Candidatus Methanofastidiosum methylthiophilus]
MNDGINFRLATENDIEYIYSMICELEDVIFDYEIFSSNYFINIRSKIIKYYILQFNEMNCGFLSLYFNRLLHHNGVVIEIQELIVSKEFRGNKIGENIIKEVVKIAKMENVSQIEVCTNKARDRTKQFYKKCNFKETHYKYTMAIEN